MTREALIYQLTQYAQGEKSWEEISQMATPGQLEWNHWYIWPTGEVIHHTGWKTISMFGNVSIKTCIDKMLKHLPLHTIIEYLCCQTRALEILAIAKHNEEEEKRNESTQS